MAADEHRNASRLLKSYVGTPPFHWSTCLGQARSVWSIWLV
jgi:hypothetical protein